MRIGVPKEIKVHEYRVGLTPASVAELVAAGHEVVVQAGAGNGIDCPDKAYEKAGAKILPDAASVARAGYKAMMQGKTLEVPGLGNKMVSLMARLAPRRLVPAVVKRSQERREH